jgi:hypothetical protein
LLVAYVDRIQALVRKAYTGSARMVYPLIFNSNQSQRASHFRSGARRDRFSTTPGPARAASKPADKDDKPVLAALATVSPQLNRWTNPRASAEGSSRIHARTSRNASSSSDPGISFSL